MGCRTTVPTNPAQQFPVDFRYEKFEENSSRRFSLRTLMQHWTFTQHIAGEYL